MKRKAVSRAKYKRVPQAVQLALILGLLSVAAYGYIASTVNTNQLLAAAATPKCDGKPRGPADAMCPPETPRKYTYRCDFPATVTNKKDPNYGAKCVKNLKPCKETVSKKVISGHCVSPYCCHADTVDGKPIGGKTDVNPQGEQKGEQPKLPELPKPPGGGGGSGGGQPQSQQDPCAAQGQGVASARGECAQQQDKSLSSVWSSFLPQNNALKPDSESREDSSIDTLSRIADASSEGGVSSTQGGVQQQNTATFDGQGLRDASESFLNDPSPGAAQPQSSSAESTEFSSQSTGFRESSVSINHEATLLEGFAERLRGALQWLGSIF